MEKDWIGNARSSFTTIGASNYALEDRAEHDFYATDPRALDLLLRESDFTLSNPVWECACGKGHLSEVLKQHGYHVLSTDLYDYGYQDMTHVEGSPAGGYDFLSCNTPWPGDILTNPPYKYAAEFVAHGMSLIQPGHQVVMFLKLTFLETKARKKLFQTCPLKALYVSSSRLHCAKNGDFTNATANAVAYGWYVFEKDYNGPPSIYWFN